MPNGTYGGVRGRKTKVGRKLSFPSYSISGPCYNVTTTFSQPLSIFYCYPNAVPFAIFSLEITFRVKAGSYPLDCSG